MRTSESVTSRSSTSRSEIAERSPGSQCAREAVSVEVALRVESDEDREHGRGVGVVHREALAGVVEGAAEPLELADDAAAVLLPPLPDPAHELLAPELLAPDALG